MEDSSKAAEAAAPAGDTKKHPEEPAPPKRQSTTIRVHFYLGPVCRSEVINPEIDFEVNKS